jgi:hypothetical protein
VPGLGLAARRHGGREGEGSALRSGRLRGGERAAGADGVSRRGVHVLLGDVDDAKVLREKCDGCPGSLCWWAPLDSPGGRLMCTTSFVYWCMGQQSTFAFYHKSSARRLVSS